MKLIERQKNFMATTITIKVVQDNEPTISIQDAIEEAFGEFDRIVKQYTRFNENSELSNLNRMNGVWVNVTDEFLMLIKFMIDLAKETEGAFDPTIIDFLEAYGYDKNYDFSKLSNPNLDTFVKDIAEKRHSWEEIEINEKEKKVKLADKQRIDLGGVGKGYAIDCAYEKLKKVCNNFLIDAGGDVRASGKNEKGEVWVVALKAMMNGEPRIIGEIELDNMSVSSSGSWARKVKQFHHIINPKTGKPTEAKYSTVFVKADTALKSDSYATALFVGGEELAKKLKDLDVRFV